MLAIARRKPECQQFANLTFEQMAIEEWPAEAGKFDVVLGLSILHLLHDPDMVIKKSASNVETRRTFYYQHRLRYGQYASVSIYRAHWQFFLRLISLSCSFFYL